jgi:hypothetical protein
MNLTSQQVQALESGELVTVFVGQTRCILLREDVYREELNLGPLSQDEMDLLACHAADLIEDSLDEPL